MSASSSPLSFCFAITSHYNHTHTLPPPVCVILSIPLLQDWLRGGWWKGPKLAQNRSDNSCAWAEDTDYVEAVWRGAGVDMVSHSQTLTVVFTHQVLMINQASTSRPGQWSDNNASQAWETTGTEIWPPCKVCFCQLGEAPKFVWLNLCVSPGSGKWCCMVPPVG